MSFEAAAATTASATSFSDLNSATLPRSSPDQSSMTILVVELDAVLAGEVLVFLHGGLDEDERVMAARISGG